jgi:hypothetical protein
MCRYDRDSICERQAGLHVNDAMNQKYSDIALFIPLNQFWGS